MMFKGNIQPGSGDAKGGTTSGTAEAKSYLLGGVLSLLLTLAAFGVVHYGLLHGGAALLVLGALALIQAVVQFRYFLHINPQKSHRDDLLLILFTVLIVALMVGGSIWVLWDQHVRMM